MNFELQALEIGRLTRVDTSLGTGLRFDMPGKRPVPFVSEEDSVATHLRELEESLLMVSMRKSERVSQLLAEGFVEFDSSGRIISKEEILASLRDEPPVKVTATGFKVVQFAPNTALVTYRSLRHSEPPVYTLRSSLWLLQQGRWRMAFHQGTLASAWRSN